MKIIIVDDEVSALHIFLDEIMYQADVEYRFFSDNPQAVLSYVETSPPDAAFLDIKMPNIDGTDLAKKLIEICPAIKIIFITGLNLSERDLPEEIRGHTLGFIYKPYDKTELYGFLDKIAGLAMHLTVSMFDTFECDINGRLVEFSSAKSKELFALLLVYNGKTLTMSDAISQLWPDHNLDKAKILYRDAVWRLRKTLQKIGFNCVNFSHGKLILNKENISCDFWDFMEGKKDGYRGEFLKNYDWSLAYLPILDGTNNNVTDSEINTTPPPKKRGRPEIEKKYNKNSSNKEQL